VTGTAIVVGAVFPGATSAALMTIEATMCFQIGKIYRGDDYEWKEAVKAAGVVGLAAITGKIVALEALTLVPFAGWAAKAAIAGGIIKGLGEAIISYYEGTESFSNLEVDVETLPTDSWLPVPRIRINPPDKNITFVGSAGAGKSSTANALLGYQAFSVGAEHGTTTTVVGVDYIDGYRIQDTPGLMDEDSRYLNLVWDAIKNSELVIYTTTGQLYRQELEIVKHIHYCQCKWDQQSNTPGRSQLALYVNMQDIKEQTKPSSVRAEESNLIKYQVTEWIPSEKIVFGASDPSVKGERQPARIDELQTLIIQHINQQK
jgi:uncharacterized protein (DUF697 family)